MAVKVQDVVTMHPHAGGESTKIRDTYDAMLKGGKK